MNTGLEASSLTIEAIRERMELQNPWEVQHDTLQPLDSNGQKFVACATCYASEKPEDLIILASASSYFTLTLQEFEQLKSWILKRDPHIHS